MNRNELFGYSVSLICLSEEDGGGWLAEVPELKGCIADGNTPDEALESLKDVVETWLEIAREEGKEIPHPRIYIDSEYSGKFTLRTPKTLHRQLVEEAEREGVSLNQFILSLIAYNFGAKFSNEGTASNDIVYPRNGGHVTHSYL
ncbi:MAG TPA: toxin-antitoxin system HicB family antitoxin [Syntrophomonas sp.]|nr:toxin-antitoxin system HicB family antitoxin [Syntrophomonas sp.]